MKAKYFILAASALLLQLLTSSCDSIISTPQAEPGILQISFDSTSPSFHLSSSSRTTPYDNPTPSLEAISAIPDTNSFLVEILTEDLQIVYSGTYGRLPKQMELAPGKYTINAVSRQLSEPLFDAPQYGDFQTVIIRSEEISAVHLACCQQNSALRIQTDKAFIAEYPGGTFYVHSSAGSLVYSYGEKRTGYFKPGTVWLEFSYAGKTNTLLTRELKAKEVLILRINTAFDVKAVSPVAEEFGDGFSIAIDTALTYKSEDYFYNPGGGNYGGNGNGGSGVDLSGALSVGEARKKASEGMSGVWVYGYIAGGDCSASSCSFSPPFKSSSNMVLSPSLSTADKQNCLAIQLQKGDIRDILNLADHPENLGRLVYLKGDLVPQYFGIAGLQNLSDYRLK